MLTVKNLSQGTPIAYYRHGGVIKTIDYVPEQTEIDSSEIPSICNEDDYISIRDLSKLTRSYISKPELQHIKKALFSKHGDNLVRGMEDKCLKLYQISKFELEDRIPKEIHLKTKIMPTPIFLNGEKQRTSCGCFGLSGAGKSYMVGNLVKDLIKMDPKLKKRVFLFTRNIEDDPAFNGIKVKRIVLDEEFLSDPITREDLHDSITIFDDVDSIPDRAIRDTVLDLRNDLLQTGRHVNNHLYITSHELTGRHAKFIMGEMNSIVLFPSSGLPAGIMRILNNYAGLSKQVVDRLIKLDTRSIYIHLKAPLYCVSDHSVILL